MKVGRREFLTGLGGVAALSAVRGFSSESFTPEPRSSVAVSPLPVKSDFTIPEGVT